MMLDPLDLQTVRSWLWRTGRTLYRYARREVSVHPETNGEYWILDLAVANAPSGSLTLFDVGANLGDWTARARECLTRHQREGITYSFEPTPVTFQFLTQRFASDSRVRPLSLAVSDEAGEFTFHVTEMAGTNSLFGAEGGVRTQVQVTTIDDLLAQRGIERVSFLKSDTEGSDLAVLRGGARSLAEGRIDVWQFEYNHRWVFSRSFLRDVFELLRGKPYVLGKLCHNRIEVFDAWHPELERYFQTNFVLLRIGTSLQQVACNFSFDRSNVPVHLARA